jgi:hypothetical protein
MQLIARARTVLFCAGALVVAFCTARAEVQQATIPLDQIVLRMQAAESQTGKFGTPYTVTRQYVLTDNDPKTPDAQVTAQIKVASPNEKTYTLSKPVGSERVEKVVRKVLDHEAEMTSHSERGEITTRNYDFALLGEGNLNGRRCYMLQLKPRRSVPELLWGKAWVDADDFRIRRVEGQPAKSPSWWLRDLQVSIDYGEVLGIWMQLASRGVANVRWMGQHVLASQALDVRTQALNATNVTPGRRPGAQRWVTNSAAWVAR